MKRAITLLCLAVSTCAPQTPAVAASPAAKVAVKDIIDGDTFVIEGEWAVVKGRKILFKIPETVKVRVLGIDTPEKGRLAKCVEESEHSKAAVVFATELISKSKSAIFLSEIQHDKYGGRIDAFVAFGSSATAFSDAMIASGYAQSYSGEGPRPDWCAILRDRPIDLLPRGFRL